MKKSQRTKKPKNENTSQGIEKRTWEPWTEKENQIFFSSIVKNSRNWGEIARDVGTKKQEQVRTYYYRVLRKVGRMLQSVQYVLDNRDKMSTLIALLGYWETKCETDFEENSKEFAESIKNSIIRQRNAIEEMRSKRLPSPDKITILLLPKMDNHSSHMNFNSKMYINESSSKKISSIVEYVKKLWEEENGKNVSSFPIRLYPQGIPQHPGYGIEDTDTTILAIYHSMGCPEVCKLEYMCSNETLLHSESSMNGELIDLYDPFYQNKLEDNILEKDISLDMFDVYNGDLLFDDYKSSDYKQTNKTNYDIDQDGSNLFQNIFENSNNSFFIKTNVFDHDSLQFICWDIGGQSSLRPSWSNYFADTNAVVFVVDSTDKERLSIAKEELEKVLAHDSLKDSLLLVLANKNDIKGALGSADISDALGLNNIQTHQWHIQSTCALSGHGLSDGFDWILQNIEGR